MVSLDWPATMASGTQSKAQRRAESQRKAAERRAAELRAKAGSNAVKRYGALVGVIAGDRRYHRAGDQPRPRTTRQRPSRPQDVKPVPIPASLHMVAAPKPRPPATRGFRYPSDQSWPRWPTPPRVRSVENVQCQAGEQLVSHVHTHLTIFVNGQARVIPYGIGVRAPRRCRPPKGAFVETGSCFYWLHTHQEDGVIHVESPSHVAAASRLGQFFAEWGIPLNANPGRAGKGQAHRLL